MSFLLTILGETKALADWKANGVRLVRRPLEPDVLTFNGPRQHWDADPLCDYGEELVLTRSYVNDAGAAIEEVWFRGTRQLVPQEASAAAQSQGYTFLGPLRWLSENVYQQPWYNATIYTSHIIANGTIGHDVKRVLDFAIANGAQLAYVAADLDILNVHPPVAEFTEKSCLAMMADLLAFAPDLVSWMDYSTAPATIRFQRRQDLAAVSLRMPSLDNEALLRMEVGRLQARPDRQIPSVKINFERIDDIDGVQFLVPFTDVYPPGATGREDGALNATVTIQGRTVVNVASSIETEAIDTSSLEWWKKHVASLRDPRRTFLSTTPLEVTRKDVDGNDVTGLPNELLPGKGQIADWMDVDWQVERITCRLYSQIVDDGDTIRIDGDEEYSVDVITTNAPVGVSSYSAVESSDSGDPVIVGLAEFLYNGLNPLRYDGAFAITERECTGAVSVGNVLNLMGSRAEYETMAALVNEVSYGLDLGTTQISVGPPRTFELNQLIALLQRFRVRRSYTNPDTQDTGELSANEGQVTLGQAAGNTNSVPGAGIPSLFVVKSGNISIRLDANNGRAAVEGPQVNLKLDVIQGTIEAINASSNVTCRVNVSAGGQIVLAGPGGTMDLQLAALGGRTVAFRDTEVCVNGVTRHVILPRTDFF